MDDLQLKTASIDLRTTESFGFVLAGGYAIRHLGIGSRASQDVDLVTDVIGQERFARAVEHVRLAYFAAGLDAR